MAHEFRRSLCVGVVVGAAVALSGAGSMAQAKTVGFGGKSVKEFTASYSSSKDFWKEDKDKIGDLWKPKDKKDKEEKEDYASCETGSDYKRVMVRSFHKECDDDKEHVKDPREDCEDDPAPVPLPAAGWLLMGSIGGLAALRRRKRV